MLGIMLVFITVGAMLVFLVGQHLLALVLQHWEKRITKETSFRLQDIFLFIDPRLLWSGNIVMALASALTAWLLSGLWWLAPVTGAIVFMVPDRIVSIIQNRRREQFDRQLPEMLLALAGALRAGAGLQSAIAQLASETAPPLSQEFALIQRQQRVGVTFEQCLDRLHGRVPTESTGLFVSALRIAMHSGGNLAEALERIAHTLHARQQIQGRIRALTSQGKMQAWVMAGLPVLLIAVLSFLDPDSMQLLWRHPAGWGVLIVVLVLEALGLWLIRRIVNIDI